ncbi:MAG TPA: thioredoxin domain-containing protein, partial [Methanomicrobiales archaeon]|nr:thioredoxin domain-containing protein [Methanomicrobiales archaeon]
AALSRVGWILNERRYIEAAEKGITFIRDTMVREGSLLHRYFNGEAGIAAFLDDYAFLTWGLIEAYEATFNPDYLKHALELTRESIDTFWDQDAGGFFFTSGEEELPVRRKDAYDGALPSSNSVALHNLLRLGRLSADTELEERALQLVRAFAPALEKSPPSHAHMMTALDFLVGPSHEVVIAGDRDAEDTHRMLEALRGYFLPHVVVLVRPPGEEGATVGSLAPFTEQMQSTDGRATAYVCIDYACQSPTTDPDVMIRELDVRTMHD